MYQNEIFQDVKMQHVQQGFNSDIVIKGVTYHVQTEDWGFHNPFLVSQIFCRGAVVRNIKIPYSKVLRRTESISDESIKIALEAQHKSVLDLLLSGQLL